MRFSAELSTSGRLGDRRRFLQRTAAGALGLAAALGSRRSAWSVQQLAAPQSALSDRLQPTGDAAWPEMYFHPGAPRNAEPLPDRLISAWQTPTSQFFIRSHGLNPQIDLTSYRLQVEGLVERPLSLSLQELTERFAQASVTCTLTCAGNRRREFSRLKPVSGVQWREGAIGNAVWSGVRLDDVLKAAGVRPEARHVWFDGLDQVQEGDRSFPFGGSIPLSRVFETNSAGVGVLLATQMNGGPLPADHGHPLRSIVPGYIGARSVKWLGRIVVSDRPSPNHFVDDVYKILEADTPQQRDEAIPIYRYPVNSAICTAEWIDAEQSAIRVAGYALPAGTAGAGIVQVEVSGNGGRTWQTAELGSDDHPYCWRLWSARLSMPLRSTTVFVRAMDSLGHLQPPVIAWNPKGYLYNSWHSVSLAR